MINNILCRREGWMMHARQTSRFKWAYVRNVGYAIKRKTSKFKCLTINGTGSDWVGNGAWSSPIVALAPPLKGDLTCLTQ